MFGRIVLFTLGIGVGVVVVLKGRAYLTRTVPQAVTDKVNETASGVVDRFATFASDARAAMAERERELRDTLGLVEDRDSDDGGDGHVPQRAADRKPRPVD